jgi:hypothetical protein
MHWGTFDLNREPFAAPGGCWPGSAGGVEDWMAC